MAKPKKPVLHLDPNIFCWMAGVKIGTVPKRFDLDSERATFAELLTMQRDGEIEMVIYQDDYDAFLRAHASRPEVIQKVRDYFTGKAKYKLQLVVVDSELDSISKEALKQVGNSNEKQDDPFQCVRSTIQDRSITHCVTLDVSLTKKAPDYDRRINADTELKEFREFRKSGIKVLFGLPSVILADLKSADHSDEGNATTSRE